MSEEKHPDYGPCDEIANGECAECIKRGESRAMSNFPWHPIEAQPPENIWIEVFVEDPSTPGKPCIVATKWTMLKGYNILVIGTPTHWRIHHGPKGVKVNQ